MAITVLNSQLATDFSNGTTVTLSSYNADQGTAGQRILVVLFSCENGGISTMTGATFDGTSMTEGVQPGSDYSRGGAIFYLLNPDATTGDIVVTSSTSFTQGAITAVILDGVEEQAPEQTAAITGALNSGDTGANITTTTDAAIVLLAWAGDNDRSGHADPTGFTTLFEDFASSFYYNSCWQIIPTAGAVDCAYTWSGGFMGTGWSSISFAPAAAGPPPTFLVPELLNKVAAQVNDVSSVTMGSYNANFGQAGRRILVVIAMWEDGGTTALSDITFNSVSLTNDSIGGGNSRQSVIRYMLDPPAITSDIVLTWAGTVDFTRSCAFILNNVVEQAPTDVASVSDSPASGPPTVGAELTPDIAGSATITSFASDNVGSGHTPSDTEFIVIDSNGGGMGNGVAWRAESPAEEIDCNWEWTGAGNIAIAVAAATWSPAESIFATSAFPFGIFIT